MRTTSILATLLTLALTHTACVQRKTPAGSLKEATPPEKSAAASEAEWIMSLQLPSGAIVNSKPGKDEPYKIVPYFANLAAIAVAEEQVHLDGIKKYMEWYLSHMNMPDKHGFHGTVYDYSIAPDGKETPTNDYDSADSYAATFISLARAYYEAGGDVAFLKSHEYQLDVIGGVMVKLLDKDNLTWVKPDNKTKYLMDNCEVFRGLDDMVFLFEQVFGAKEKAAWYKIHADNVRNAIMTKLKRGNSFLVYSMPGDNKTPNWKVWYADATSQLFPIIFGVIDPASVEAKAIYEKFNANHPQWMQLKFSDAFPWAIIGYAATVMGDTARASAYRDAVKAKFVDQGHPWPWYSAEAGWYVRLLQNLK